MSFLKKIHNNENAYNNEILYKFMTPYVLKEKYSIKIPLNIYQTWHTKKLPYKMYNNICLMKKNNPEFKYFLFDDNDCREFIKNNFEQDVLIAFDKLIPGAYKADLWRYCILYKHGGIYIDIKFKCINNFKLIALVEKEHFVHDLNENGIYNALIVSKPGNQILLNCINKIVENVKNNYYGDSMLHPTGPMLMEDFFNKEMKNDIELRLETFDYSNIHQHLIKYNDKYIMSLYNGYREEQKLYQKKEHYSILWKNKYIYNTN
jgi:mannosyltransferase OCH1-like enzyme